MEFLCFNPAITLVNLPMCMKMGITPEEYFIEATPYVPGSDLPVLVYRKAVADCENEDAIKERLESNGGWRKGVRAHIP